LNVWRVRRNLLAALGERMAADLIKIILVSRTIGADRGRAARGRPQSGFDDAPSL
jgi:hypothetical protein